MNRTLPILVLLLCHFSLVAQTYLRGEVRDEQGKTLPNARILLHSTGYVYTSGGSGSFGIITPARFDSVTVSLSGYQEATLGVDATKYSFITLKLLRSTVSIQKNKLLSITKDLAWDQQARMSFGGESYSARMENEFVDAGKYPETGFAVRIDKASYSNIRRFLNMDTRIPPDAVRIEEMLNYFNFGYSPPSGGNVFGIRHQLSDCPWNPDSRLLFLNLSAKKIDTSAMPPSNLVFLIDVSGSMDLPNRLPLLKAAFKLLIDNLRARDTVSIVVYGSAVGVFLVPTSGSEKEKIRKAIEDLQPAGSTPGESGIINAYRLARSQFIEGGNNRVILATDGDFNVGESSEEHLEQLITSHQESGIYLTCLGVGMGNYKDSKLEALARKGNGNFAYLDSEEEAEKVLVKELTQTLYSVADNASMYVHFNRDLVSRYRLIGYDNKIKALADSVMEIEGGEVGSGYSTMVIFEIMPNTPAPAEEGELAAVTVNYRLPADSMMYKTIWTISPRYTPFGQLDRELRFATSVVMFGSLLKESGFTKSLTWQETMEVAQDSFNPDDAVQAGFIPVLEKAKKIYLKKRRRSQR